MSGNFLWGDAPLQYNIGVYVRESRDDNEEYYETIETQRDLLLQYVEKINLGRVYRVYIDDNVSGAGFERRGIDELKQDISARLINCILIKDLSRLGRNNAKTLLFLDYLEENGVRVVTFDGRYDSVRDNDMVGIETWFNERYIRDISRKTRANLRYKIESGEYIGHAPYGYVKDLTEKNKLVVDHEEAAVVKEIFRLYKEGFGYRYIAQYLSSKGVASPSQSNGNVRCSAVWSPVTIQRILTNRVYVGDTIQGVSEKISFKSKKTRKLPKERWVITPDTHEGILERNEFNEIQDLRMERAKFKNPHKGVIHLFKGVLYCGGCGSAMFARIRSQRPMGYICSGYAKFGKAKCTSHYINEEVLLDVIINELLVALENINQEEKLRGILEKGYSVERTIESDIIKQKQQLAQRKRQQEMLYLDKLEGRISNDLFMRMNVSLESKICLIKNDIEVLENKNNHKERTLDTNIIGRLRNLIGQRNINNEIIRLMVEKIIITNPGDSLEQLKLNQEEIARIGNLGGLLIVFKYKNNV